MPIVARVLIVEDDADVRDWVAHCMLGDGHEIRGVPDGATLRRLRADEPGYLPDLVLMDYALPDVDGVALLAELEEVWPDVAAVFVTVQWTGEIIDRIAQTGRERIAKPFQPDDLRAAARRALGTGGRQE
ncbi:response regulator [Nocardioides sp. MAH-18]|uniref:Response regulator n=1 Tax=Nocardioides agri TaxID=2682843 RepID=A0A6L6XP61_9ACTN|nr:response regulator [Nocardioides sp. MAH-18]MVQ49059.1 response regulator [Nocardioides sp. MAH-18]